MLLLSRFLTHTQCRFLA